MRCKIYGNLDEFWPTLIYNNKGSITSSEHTISAFLGLKYIDYVNLIIQTGGKCHCGSYYSFETEKECQKFIEEHIEPGLVMYKLMK